MKYKFRYLFMILAVVGLAAFFFVIESDATVNIETYTDISSPPSIYPDYTDLVIPSNIAPMNFRVEQPGEQYFVRIYTSDKQNIEIVSGEPEIIIPLKKWRKLLRANQGKELFYDVYVMAADGSWQRYQTISNKISNENEDIDSHVVYRRLKPNYNWYNNVGVFQRNLENFDESVVVHGKSFGDGCVNCHTVNNNDPKNMLLGFRGKFGNDTILVEDGKAEKLGTTFGHTSWHPSGKVAALSKYRVQQFFHFAGREEVRDVVELDSCVLYYDFRSKSVKTIKALADKEILETHPSWSPDGRYLYFVSAPVLWEDRYHVPPENFKKVKYSLMRISYDIYTDTWGELETVLSSEKTGLSILMPRISPDGRYLLFNMCEYSCFSLFQTNSDLYMMDLETGEYEKLEMASSDKAEGWHSWSSNGRWIVFSSKRDGGIFTRLCISHVDKDGKAHKSFMLPQKSAAFYDSLIDTFNTPEFSTGPIEISERELGRVIRSKSETELKLPITGATPKAGAGESR
ncbi:MAG: hypothetical protein K9M75_13010 [Phycisphaerae bacterium]|nr:hypothetical protein [Phycisphaerae bacterium]